MPTPPRQRPGPEPGPEPDPGPRPEPEVDGRPPVTPAPEPVLTVADLIATLEVFDPDTPVNLAIRPAWPHVYTLGAIAHAPDGVLYLAQGVHLGHLSEPVRDVLDW